MKQIGGPASTRSPVVSEFGRDMGWDKSRSGHSPLHAYMLLLLLFMLFCRETKTRISETRILKGVVAPTHTSVVAGVSAAVFDVDEDVLYGPSCMR